MIGLIAEYGGCTLYTSGEYSHYSLHPPSSDKDLSQPYNNDILITVIDIYNYHTLMTCL